MDAKKIHLIILGNGSKMSRMFVVAMTTVPNASFQLDAYCRRAIFKFISVCFINRERCFFFSFLAWFSCERTHFFPLPNLPLHPLFVHSPWIFLLSIIFSSLLQQKFLHFYNYLIIVLPIHFQYFHVFQFLFKTASSLSRAACLLTFFT
jgi:hypothetical protein